MLTLAKTLGDPIEMSTTEQANVDLITANKVRDLLNRNGIPPRSHNTTIANVLGLSFSVVTRKMKGLIPWNLSQLQDIATHFGVPPAILLDDKGTQPATAETDFVALQWQGEWLITERQHAREGRTYPVDVIELRSAQPNVYAARIAVVDDSQDVAETVCEYFIEKGVNAIPYFDGATFRKALEVEDFDGYILDWMLGDQTAAELVRGIRSSENSGAPIFLLTGKISTGEASEDEIAHIVSHYNARCEEKPVRLPILFAEVARELKITLPAAAAAN